MADTLAALLHETETPWGPSMSGDSCPGLSAHGAQAARLAAANVVVLTPETLAAALHRMDFNGRDRVTERCPHDRDAALPAAALREAE